MPTAFAADLWPGFVQTGTPVRAIVGRRRTPRCLGQRPREAVLLRVAAAGARAKDL